MKVLGILLAMVMLFSGVAFAGSYPVVEDTIMGRNDSAPMLFTPYVAKTWKDAVGNADVRVELNYTSSVRSFTDNNSVGVKVGLEM